MATKKSSTKGGAKKSTKAGARPGALPPYGEPIRQAASRPGPLPPYGEVIRQSIAGGNTAEMKRVAASARKHLKDVQTALDKLNKKLGK
ncbi:MAG TPA: DUF1843 domain-containing protein [Pyrinomonadaceae bacterium]|nr:DUF1843 domain-containing protein [Pyrinomonadaceae bacterium]